VEAHLHVPFVKRFERAVEHAQCDRRAPVTVAHEFRVKAPVLHHLTVCWHALLIRLAREMLDHMLTYQTYTSTNKLNVRQLLLRYIPKQENFDVHNENNENNVAYLVADRVFECRAQHIKRIQRELLISERFTCASVR
jgi:hypothetical protein